MADQTLCLKGITQTTAWFSTIWEGHSLLVMWDVPNSRLIKVSNYEIEQEDEIILTDMIKEYIACSREFLNDMCIM